MDDPRLDHAEHITALHGLTRLNWASGSVRIVWKPIRQLSRQLGTTQLRVLDVGTGAGDVLRGLWKRARRRQLQLDLHGIDISDRAVAHARQRCLAAGARIQYSQLNVLEDPLPEDYDVLISSLFFHHLSEKQVVWLLEKMAAATRHLLLVSDLRRSYAGLLLAHAAGRLLTRSRVVHTDAPRSVRAAFTPAEMLALAREARLVDAHITRHWPCRFLCSWRKPPERPHRAP